METSRQEEADTVATCTDAQSCIGCATTVPADAPSMLVLKRLLAAHEAWFDVTRDFHFAGRTFTGFAEFHSHGEQYVLSKRAKLWEVDTHEYIFFEIVEHLEEAIFRSDVDFMTAEAIRMVKPAPNHMSSNISLVIVADAMDADVEPLVRRTKFRKNHLLGLQGWTDLRIAVVDLAGGLDGRILTNAAGKTLRPTIEQNLGQIPGEPARRPAHR